MATIQCATACTVTLQIEPTPITLERIQDMGLVWSGFLLAAIVVLGLRKIFDIFDKAPHGE
jgi:hypothetical protein